jgi:hypothetical protein
MSKRPPTSGSGKRSRTAIPDPYADQATAPIDITEMEAAARLSTHVEDPDDARMLPAEDEPTRAPTPTGHIVRRALGSSPDGVPPYAEVRIAGAGGLVKLPVRQVTRTGVALEIAPGAAIDAADGVSVQVELFLGNDVNGQAIRARLAGTVAHHRRSSASMPGGVSLRWELSEPGARETLELLLARIAPTG